MNQGECEASVQPREDHGIWCQSPDGRPMAPAGDLDRALGRPPRGTPDAIRISELEPFIQGCLSLLPDSLEEGRLRLGFLLFTLGAVDRFWAIHGLDDRRFQPYAEQVLERFGVSPGVAATLVAALPQLPGDPFALETLRQGAETLESWVLSRDPNVALGLHELMAHWRRL